MAQISNVMALVLSLVVMAAAAVSAQEAPAPSPDAGAAFSMTVSAALRTRSTSIFVSQLKQGPFVAFVKLFLVVGAPPPPPPPHFTWCCWIFLDSACSDASLQDEQDQSVGTNTKLLSNQKILFYPFKISPSQTIRVIDRIFWFLEPFPSFHFILFFFPNLIPPIATPTPSSYLLRRPPRDTTVATVVSRLPVIQELSGLKVKELTILEVGISFLTRKCSTAVTLHWNLLLDFSIISSFRTRLILFHPKLDHQWVSYYSNSYSNKNFQEILKQKMKMLMLIMMKMEGFGFGPNCLPNLQ
ncbi:hypothetical protein M9H77_29621 [Catharanthus roseus]|uniref:Uncharacterized protein n=1 Tax=Catharanthus roseus TaxID=4058 RepID=A0ACB9ZVB4_CATRO|nr:hypothetical protein M9H77_29621 [Catharanthus roseus]